MMAKMEIETVKDSIAAQIIHINDYELKPAIPVLGGACLAYEHIQKSDFVSACKMLLYCMKAAIMFEWPGGAVDAARTFCALCRVDPRLVEGYIGYRFSELERRLASTKKS